MKTIKKRIKFSIDLGLLDTGPGWPVKLLRI